MDLLHVEICQKADSTLSIEDIKNLVFSEIMKSEEIKLGTIIDGPKLSTNVMKTHIESIIYSCGFEEKYDPKLSGANFKVHVYRLTQEDAATETMENDNDELAVSSHWILPSREFYLLWENLYFDNNIKETLLDFVETSIIFSDYNINSNIITWNKVVLLQGPPGTGKTSLCKALAQKVAIRFGDRFSHGEFIEINSHSLFSKWFSESGKLVMKLFNELKRLLENQKAFVCILIDEIESLAHIRKSCSNGAEPTDSIRVVNALLTQLDQIKRYPNVLILTTSNLSEAIDLAFIDRADIKQYIGNPTTKAIYKIYVSCLEELMKKKLIQTEQIYDLQYLKEIEYENSNDTRNSLEVLKLSQESVGLSGRILRKIPFLAYALYFSTPKCSLSSFLAAMGMAVLQQKEKSDT